MTIARMCPTHVSPDLSVWRSERHVTLTLPACHQVVTLVRCEVLRLQATLDEWLRDR